MIVKKIVVWSSKEDNNPTTLDLNGGESLLTYGINNLGNIVGSIRYDDVITPVFWASKDDKPISLKLNGGTSGFAYGINNLGQIVGSSNIGDISIVLVWSSKDDDKPTILKNLNGGTFGNEYGINNLGQIVGSINYNNGVRTPVFWASKEDENPTSLKLNGGTNGIAYGINNLGNIVGNSTSTSNNEISTSVVWASKDDEKPITLKLNGGTQGEAKGINNLGQIVGYINYNNGVPTPVVWASKDDDKPTKLNFNGGIGGAGFGMNDLGQIVGNIAYDDSATTTYATTTYATTTYATTTYATTTAPPVISNICFPAGTLITTDQGPVPIEKLDTTKHSIAGDPILHVVKTILLDKYLICFPKHSIKQHMPTQETLISKEHKIFYQNKFLKASQFLELCPEVKKVKYNGECLYNVLLAKYTTMQVNNITCETLHPKNMIAKLYMKNFTEFGRNQIILQINKSLVSKNEAMYKSVTKQLT